MNKELQKQFNIWNLTNNLTALAEVVVLAERILEFESFPLEKWKNKKQKPLKK